MLLISYVTSLTNKFIDLLKQTEAWRISEYNNSTYMCVKNTLQAIYSCCHICRRFQNFTFKLCAFKFAYNVAYIGTSNRLSQAPHWQWVVVNRMLRLHSDEAEIY